MLTPKTVEVMLHPSEVHEYIADNYDKIVWDRNTKHLHEQHLDHHRNTSLNVSTIKGGDSMTNFPGGMASSQGSQLKQFMKRQRSQARGLGTMNRETEHHNSGHFVHYEFQLLTSSNKLGPGLGFGELALMPSGGKKNEKRAATIIAD